MDWKPHFEDKFPLHAEWIEGEALGEQGEDTDDEFDRDED